MSNNGSRSVVRQLNRNLAAVEEALKHAHSTVNEAEEGLSALAKRVLAAEEKRKRLLHGMHSAHARINESKKGGSRRRGSRGRRSTKRR
jgi:hypothetical protein